MSTELTPFKPLVLSGDGYTILVSPEAEKLKAELITLGAGVGVLTVPSEAENARLVNVRVNGFLRELETTRVAVKDPFLVGGRKVDELARQCGIELQTLSKTIETKLQKFAADQLAEKRKAEAEAHRLEQLALQQKADADRKLREAEELKRKAAEAPFTAAVEAPPAAIIEKVAEAKTAHADFLATSAQQQAATVASVAPLVSGVKPKLNFRVKNLHLLYGARPEFVELTERRREILSAINNQHREGDALPAGFPGIEVFEDFQVSSR